MRKVFEEIRPMLGIGGGDVEVSDGGIVKIGLKDASGVCPMGIYTPKLGIERKLRG